MVKEITRLMTVDQIQCTIDQYIEQELNIVFVCNFALAHVIYDYLHNDYGIIAEYLELNSDINEYYVSITFYKGDLCLIIENAKIVDEFKINDIYDGVDYYIFINLDRKVAKEKLLGGKHMWLKLADDNFTQLTFDFGDEEIFQTKSNGDVIIKGVLKQEECKCEKCTCCDDNELSDEILAEIDLINEYVDKIGSDFYDKDGLVSLLLELFEKGRNIGFTDAIDLLRNYIEELN